MARRATRTSRSLALAILMGAAPATLPAVAQVGGGYDLTWSTIDCGGATFSAGGAYTLGGTIGQPDAGPAVGTMSGGIYALTGGFWPAAAVPQCACPGHMTGNTVIRGTDIQAFVACYALSVGANCVCADMNSDGILNSSDVSQFVSSLLTAGTCP